MVKEHVKCKDLADNLRVDLVPGCHIIVCQCVPARQVVQWEGPWLVLRTFGLHGMGIEVLDGKQRIRAVATSNCRLFRG